ncbi:hypothetical protein NOS3756_55350 [Nostoc sp. NIES-3756]|nr:hypothetical protein NOS3756_55350 [Nostoc sp. NIES-3756]BAY35721.1 hypothetical protein NIES2111_00370 [Nostoc sp. NIES-2111]
MPYIGSVMEDGTELFKLSLASQEYTQEAPHC